jgi:hypothetical protein
MQGTESVELQLGPERQHLIRPCRRATYLQPGRRLGVDYIGHMDFGTPPSSASHYGFTHFTEREPGSDMGVLGLAAICSFAGDTGE